MNENIDLCEILKDCPAGIKLYTPLVGDVYLKSATNTIICSSEVQTNDIRSIFFDRKGRVYSCYKNGECLLFPSKDQRDWSKWKCTKPKFDPKTLKAFDRVLARDADDREWLALLFSHINTKGKVIVAGCVWEQVIPYNDDTKHLVGTTEEAPEYYRYWED